MSTSPDRLYHLLPPLYQQRDAAQGYPLRQLLQVIATQVNLIEADIAHLYDDWFIETCDDWVVPYIGDLIGHRSIQRTDDPATAAVLVQRQDVANTLDYRRRKGTLALLEEMASSATEWPARVVECARSVGLTQHLDHLRRQCGRTLDIHEPGSLDLLGTPFDAQSRTLGLAAQDPSLGAGRFNTPSVALFVWRTKVYPVTECRASSVEQAGNHCYSFSVLGNDTPLFNHPVSAGKPAQIARELDLPTPIRREALAEAALRKDKTTTFQASSRYYGEGQSLSIRAGRWAGCDPTKPIPPEKILPADLSGWKYRPRQGYIAVDPELGRIVFPPTQLPEQDVIVSYYYAFNADLGGGEYLRPVKVYPNSKIYCVGADAEFSHIHSAHAQWIKDKPANAVIQINDSGVYGEQMHFEVGDDQHLQLRAANGTRPVISLHDWQASRPDAMTITGKPRSRFTLDGILITGRGIEIRGAIEQVTIRHSTLVPGWALNSNCTPRRTEEPSLQLVETSADLSIDHSILGTIQVVGGHERKTGPNHLQITDSIVDSTGENGAAILGLGEAVAPFAFTVKRSTILGRVETHSIELAENSIFTGKILVARRQFGCMRFCYVPPGSRTPQRYYCQPDLVNDSLTGNRSAGSGTESSARAVHSEELMRVEPQFASILYGQPQYCRLADGCAMELKMGADDRSEMGVFHDLFEAQRESDLLSRLEEYTPAGITAGILHAT
jgi:hypothetical protein